MQKFITSLVVGVAFAASASLAQAGGHLSWKLSAEDSTVAFGSVKKDTVGEVHSFGSLSGSMTEQGAVTVEIDVASVQTNIDIRNERMLEWVLNNGPKALLNAEIDMSEIDSMAPGDTKSLDVEGTLTVNGNVVELDVAMFVAMLADGKLLVTTSDMIMLSMEEVGLTAGIDKLMELAKLPGITRVSPVTLRMVFTRHAKHASADATVEAATTVAALSGDVKAGKKAFKSCKACHAVKKPANKVGPHLNGILGRDIAAVSDFNYSGPLAALSGKRWTVEALDAFLTNPQAYAAGNAMAFGGMPDETDRLNLITYLQSVPVKP